MKRNLLLILFLLPFTLMAQFKLTPFIGANNAPLAYGDDYYPNKTGILGGVTYREQLFLSVGFDYLTTIDVYGHLSQKPRLQFVTNAYSISYRFLNRQRKVSPMISINFGYGIYSNGKNQKVDGYANFTNEDASRLDKLWYYSNARLLADFRIKRFNLRVGPVLNYYVMKMHYVNSPFTMRKRGIGGIIELIYQLNTQKPSDNFETDEK